MEGLIGYVNRIELMDRWFNCMDRWNGWTGFDKMTWAAEQI
jgi:hypothetical protein